MGASEGGGDNLMNVILMVETFIAFILAVTIHGAVQARVATLLGVHFGPVDTILTGAGVIALVGALFAMVSLRGVRPSVPQPAATPLAPEPPPVVALPPLAAEVEQPIIR